MHCWSLSRWVRWPDCFSSRVLNNMHSNHYDVTARLVTLIFSHLIKMCIKIIHGCDSLRPRLCVIAYIQAKLIIFDGSRPCSWMSGQLSTHIVPRFFNFALYQYKYLMHRTAYGYIPLSPVNWPCVVCLLSVTRPSAVYPLVVIDLIFMVGRQVDRTCSGVSVQRTNNWQIVLHGVMCFCITKYMNCHECVIKLYDSNYYIYIYIYIYTFSFLQ